MTVAHIESNICFVQTPKQNTRSLKAFPQFRIPALLLCFDSFCLVLLFVSCCIVSDKSITFHQQALALLPILIKLKPILDFMLFGVFAVNK